MPMMLEAALRAAILIALVWAVTALVRPDVRVKAVVWRAMLCSALAIPLLMPFSVVRVNDRAIERVIVTAGKEIAGVLPKAVFVHYGPGFSIAFYVYAAIALVLLIRVIAGLLLTWQVARHSPPINAPWVDGVAARSCRRISVPVTLGHTILIPSDWPGWPASKRIAVIAHERTHVENHDFYWQLLAQIHRAVFWFNPLAWWLLAEMSRLDELVSDEAAIAAMDDRPHYAEVLLTMSNTQDYLPSGIAMAKTAGIKDRVEHVLSAVIPATRLSRGKRIVISAVAVPLALVFAVGFTPAHGKMLRPKSVGEPHVCIRYYPAVAVRTGQQGTSTVRFDITTEGAVANLQIAQSSGSQLLDDAAIACAKGWQYTPATKDGVPVQVPWRAQVRWSLNGPQYDD